MTVKPDEWEGLEARLKGTLDAAWIPGLGQFSYGQLRRLIAAVRSGADSSVTVTRHEPVDWTTLRLEQMASGEDFDAARVGAVRSGKDEGSSPAAIPTEPKADGFSQYRRSQLAELRPYNPGEILSARVSISASDIEAGSPKAGDMIARNPANHEDQWLVAADYFAANFEPVEAVVVGWQNADDVPVWAVGIVTDGENVAHAQKAEADYGGCYWSVEEGNGALEWEPTLFIEMPAQAAPDAKEPDQ